MIDDKNLKTIIEEVIGNNDLYLNTTVYDIVKKIIDLPSETTTTIADLIKYDPKEKFVEPIKQGEINYFVKEVCKKINIKLEKNGDSFGGLAYYYKFKKNCDNNSYIKNEEKEREEKILEMFEKMPEKTRTPIEKEFDKYAELYKKRFNKNAYIPEPSGTIEFAIECIKKCLDEDKDMLDELYYPNFEKDMEDGVLY